MQSAKIDILKAKLANDVFSTQAEAYVRSMDMGFEGATHVTEDQIGQAFYMPASTHEEYLAYYAGEMPEEDDMMEEEATPMEVMEYAIAAVVESIMVSTVMQKNIEGQILKTDDEQRIVYGWASVVTENGVPVVDRQGDVIEADTLVKAVNDFMEHVRVGKTMHSGEQTGMVIHSLPVTKEICESLGIQCNREGWIVAYKVYDDAVWAMVKSGELAAFSIGGRAVKEEY